MKYEGWFMEIPKITQNELTYQYRMDKPNKLIVKHNRLLKILRIIHNKLSANKRK